jgi:Asp-tRNA(Asn)/Glu-tRNA(Gln) amidotransferase A subunit family amidase
MPKDRLTATAIEIQASLTANAVTSDVLIDLYLGHIERHNDRLKAVVSTTLRHVLYLRATILTGSVQMVRFMDRSTVSLPFSKFLASQD